MAFLRSHLEPVVFFAQIASSFFDTGLQMVVKQRYENTTIPGAGGEHRSIADFYMVFNILTKVVPIFPAFLLAQIGDKGYRKVPVVVPLIGYFVSRALLLLVIAFDWRVEVMYASPVVNGLCGGFSSYWPGVITLVSLSTSEEVRSLRIMRTELTYGLAGFLGSLASGHLFQLYALGHRQGFVLSCMSVVLYFVCLVYAAFILQVNTRTPSADERRDGESVGILNRDKVNIALLIAAGILYDVAVAGGVEILNVYVLVEPLSWTATQVGYGNAAGSVIFITSFLGVKLFTRCSLSDTSMIMIGMFSFLTGIYFMTFVTTTTTYYLARTLTLFALIPMPTIRSLLSKQIRGSSYGKTFTGLQLSFQFVGLATTYTYTEVYQSTLHILPGFVFTLSSIITFLAMIPISIIGCRTARQGCYERL
ncbi:thymic stromal cotransporter homolog [Ictalurus punctatus]|uniref:Thymic stromal cotransporter homolog n=1 Tax=Ictalurus punctatus TaxID=7998 RepID=A0A2D0SSJ9_ICTPU|nr:thymic stromal cotransporter homolog [Ictalurus punctatus]